MCGRGLVLPKRNWPGGWGDAACCCPPGERAWTPVDADAGALGGSDRIAVAHQVRADRQEAARRLKGVAGPALGDKSENGSTIPSDCCRGCPGGPVVSLLRFRPMGEAVAIPFGTASSAGIATSSIHPGSSRGPMERCGSAPRSVPARSFRVPPLHSCAQVLPRLSDAGTTVDRL